MNPQHLQHHRLRLDLQALWVQQVPERQVPRLHLEVRLVLRGQLRPPVPRALLHLAAPVVRLRQRCPVDPEDRAGLEVQLHRQRPVDLSVQGGPGGQPDLAGLVIHRRPENL